MGAEAFAPAVVAGPTEQKPKPKPVKVQTMLPASFFKEPLSKTLREVEIE